ncbi:hypothetical protein NP493_240g01037 [Ridgeia piscesae]|uniref:Uncharacterized protein n=1 Tax=Ridgeia piscesae TaxID=27915 RepID=A0AAD9UDD1_RIDPI|nr:hypothetical protein NP493_240g01037 [Ridgeia piscesae]
MLGRLLRTRSATAGDEGECGGPRGEGRLYTPHGGCEWGVCRHRQVAH